MDDKQTEDVDIEIEIDEELHEWAVARSRDLGYDRVEDYVRDLIVEQLEIEERKRSEA